MLMPTWVLLILALMMLGLSVADLVWIHDRSFGAWFDFGGWALIAIGAWTRL